MNRWGLSFFGALVLLSFQAGASLVIETGHVHIRKVILTKEEDSKTDYVITSESFESMDLHKITSGGKNIALNTQKPFVFVSEEIFPMDEIWSFPADGSLTPVKFGSPGSEDMDLEQYNTNMTEEQIAASSNLFFSLVGAELPGLKNISPTIEAPPGVTHCLKGEDENTLTCTQSLQIKVKFSTDRYENFRKIGIEPVLILRGNTQGA